MPPLLLSSFQLSMLQFDIAMSGWRRFPDGMTEQIERDRNANQRRAARDLDGGLITAPLFHVAAPAETCGLHPRFPSLPPPLNTYQGTHFFAAKAPMFVMPGQTTRMSRVAPKARQDSPDVYMLHVYGVRNSPVQRPCHSSRLSGFGSLHPPNCKSATSRAPPTSATETPVARPGVRAWPVEFGLLHACRDTAWGRFVGCHHILCFFPFSGLFKTRAKSLQETCRKGEVWMEVESCRFCVLGSPQDDPNSRSAKACFVLDQDREPQKMEMLCLESLFIWGQNGCGHALNLKLLNHCPEQQSVTVGRRSNLDSGRG